MNAAERPRTALSMEELHRVAELLYSATGMIFGESKRYYIERRVAERVAKTGLGDPAAYLRALPTMADETEMLVNAFTVNETYFYREDHQFRALSRAILPDIVRNRRPGDLVRIWSLPCSSGEEPYSVAIWLLENWPLVDAWHIEILGSDIDTAALTQARAGRYGARALARMPPHLRDRYFQPLNKLEWEIVDDLKESVEFRPVNLIDARAMARHGRFDVIFCRNLLIYFDENARRKAAERLFASLNPGGYLCLGRSESLTQIGDRFEFVRFDDAIVYRRP